MENEKIGIFGKILAATDQWLENYIQDTRNNLMKGQMPPGQGLMDDSLMRHSLYAPPDLQFTGQGYKEKTSRIGFTTLRLMSYRDSVIAAIIQTRLNQVSNFSGAQVDKYHPGYIISLRDPKEQSTDADEQKIADLQKFISHCGVTKDIPISEQCSFDTFLRKIVRDRLTYDTVAIEKIRDRLGNLHHFVPVDASTIRFVSKAAKPQVKDIGKLTSVGENDVSSSPTEAEADTDKAEYIQLVEGQIKRAFSRDEMAVRFGNPVNDIYANGYSIGELELLINIVTAHLYAENYNRLFFTQGHVTKGILHLEAQIPQQKLEAFKQQWYAQTSGNVNSWRTPIIAGPEKVNWITLNPSNRDMEFNSWMSYLIKVACAIYQISPSEIGFDISSGVGEESSQALFDTSNESEIKHSVDKGLKPLLRFVEDIINEEILNLADPDGRYQFRFVGMDVQTQEQEVNRNAIEIRAFKTIDEVRSEHGLSEIGPDRGGNLILDGAYISWLQQQAQMQQQMPPEEGMPEGEMMAPEDDDEGHPYDENDDQVLDEEHEEDEGEPSGSQKFIGQGQMQDGGGAQMGMSLNKSKKKKRKEPRLLKVSYYIK